MRALKIVGLVVLVLLVLVAVALPFAIGIRPIIGAKSRALTDRHFESTPTQVMRTGMAKARKIHDAMPWKGYGNQTDDDLKAIFAYLKTVAPVKHRVDNTL